MMQDVSAAPVAPDSAQNLPSDDITGAPETFPNAANEIAHEWLKGLPEEVVAWLVRTVGAREMWSWLGKDDNLSLCRAITRGFQFNPQALRQPIVRVRLTKHLALHAEELAQIVELWLDTKPTIIETVESLDDDHLIEQLPQLWKRFGGEALILTLARARRERALEGIENIGDAVAALEENADDSAPTPAQISPQVLADDATEETDKAESPHAAAIITRLQNQLEEARNHHDALLKTLSQAQESARRVQEKLRLELLEAQRQFKAQTRHLQSAQSELGETQKTLDRTSRRLRHIEKEWEETSGEDKKLRRQMRRQQEISEDLRKQLAQMAARLEPFEPAKPAPPPVVAPAPKTVSLSPLDKLYVWKSDGQQFRVSPRDVQRRVDANDEEWVFRLIQALDALKEVHPEGHRLFQNALRNLDFYYSRVLTQNTTRVLVDASNVTRHEKNKWGKGQLQHLFSMRDELRRRDCFPIQFIADASLPHNIDKRDELMAMVARGEIEMTRVGQEADEILAREARRSGAYVVTNDRAFFHKVTPDFEPPRITFRIHDGFLIVDDF